MDHLPNSYSYYGQAIGIFLLVLSVVGEYCGQLDQAMFVPGTLGNTLTVLVIWKTRRLHNHCTTFLLNLALSNLLCCATSMPVMPFQ